MGERRKGKGSGKDRERSGREEKRTRLREARQGQVELASARTRTGGLQDWAGAGEEFGRGLRRRRGAWAKEEGGEEEIGRAHV